MRFLPTPLVQRSLGILGMAAILLVGCTSARPVTAPVQVPTTEAREQVQPPATAAPPATVVTPVQAPSAYEKERDRLVAQLDNPAFWERLAYDSSRQMRSAAVGWAAERALLLNPASVPALRARARHCLYHWTCTPGDAVSALEQAQAIAPKEVDVTMELARAYVLTRQPQKALALYDQMVAFLIPPPGAHAGVQIRLPPPT